MIREVCCATLEAVRSAARRGADRVELCAALEVGGVTPSAGLIAQAVREGLPVQVLIRPRSGDFVYDAGEVEAMCADIRQALGLGASGVVIGALTAEGDLDVPVCRQLLEATQVAGLSVSPSLTFHRAFDVCRNPFQVLEQVIGLGFHRILTSGQAPTAEEGIPLLRRLAQQAAGRIVLLAGCGVTPDNAQRILRETGVQEVHGSRL